MSRPDESYSKPDPTDTYSDRNRLHDPDADVDADVDVDDADPDALLRNGDLHYLDPSQFTTHTEFLDADGGLHGFDELTQSIDLINDPGDVIMDTSTLILSAEGHSGGENIGRKWEIDRKPVPAGLTPINTQGETQKKYIGIYSPDARKKRIQRFFEKRRQRVWTKKVKYDVRKNFADSRLRVKGRFVKKEDEELLRELMNLT